jgi:hypothetical protein
VKEMKNERNCKEDNDAYESEKKIMKKYGRQGEDKWESMVDKDSLQYFLINIFQFREFFIW